MSTAEVLEKALALLEPNGENWFQVRNGEACGDGKLCAYLALGAVDEGHFQFRAHGFLSNAIGKQSIIGWNDRAKDWHEVEAGFRRAIELAKQSEARA
jgi:hypothetical protein